MRALGVSASCIYSTITVIMEHYIKFSHLAKVHAPAPLQRSSRRHSQEDAEVIRMSQWVEIRHLHLVEGVAHHATVLTTSGDSYWLKAATRNHASRVPQ